MDYQSEHTKTINVTTDNSTSHGPKIGKIITFDERLSKSRTDMEIYEYYGVTCYNPAKTMPYRGYARTKYDQLPQRLVYFTREYLKTDLVDVLAANTGSLILILKTPTNQVTTISKDNPVVEPEFMVLERFGMWQSTGEIHWRNRPDNYYWFAELQIETSEFLLKQKFADLHRVSELFDLVVGMLDRRDYSLQDTKHD